MAHLGTAIRTLREQAGLTQAELAQRAGLNQSYVSRLENLNRDRVDAHSLAMMAQAMEVSIEEIYLVAGLAPSRDRTADVQWAQLERVFRSLPHDRQAELLAIARTLASLARPTDDEPAEDVAHDQQPARR